MNFKEEVVKRLKSDCEYLIKTKLPKALENIGDDKGVNTYRNLIKALADNIKLIDEYTNDYIDMWSIYRDGESLTPTVSVWRQNIDGDIKDHHAFEVKVETVFAPTKPKFTNTEITIKNNITTK